MSISECSMSRWYSPETVLFRGEAFAGVYVSQEKLDIHPAYVVDEEAAKSKVSTAEDLRKKWT